MLDHVQDVIDTITKSLAISEQHRIDRSSLADFMQTLMQAGKTHWMTLLLVGISHARS
jgi:hypothetical protein